MGSGFRKSLELANELEDQARIVKKAEGKSRKDSWTGSRWKILALATVVVVTIAIVGGAYTMKWSKIKVSVKTVFNGVSVRVFIDETLKVEKSLTPEDYQTLGVWSASVGSHTLHVNRGYNASGGPLIWESTYLEVFDLGPFSTKSFLVNV